MLARTQDIKLKGIFLPAVDPAELVSYIKVEEVKEK
jgi:hypothetical protein